MAPDDVKHQYRLETFETIARSLGREDAAQMHELTVSVSWPHRPQDLAFLLEVGEGFLACDEIGRALGSGMYFPMGDDFATVGMMITSPRLQARGAGRWLLRRILEACDGRDLRLNATRESYRLYESEGFRPVGTVFQRQGTARAIPLPEVPAGCVPRDLAPGDLDALADLDRAAFTADRRHVLAATLPLCEGTVLERDGRMVGAALCRPFGRGRVVGPILAEDAAAAMALVGPFAARHAGGFLRVDTAEEETAFTAFLDQAGLGVYDTVTAMTLGQPRPAAGPARMFGLMSHTLG